MDLNKYQDFCKTTEAGPVKEFTHEMRLLYFALGLCGEAGEAAEKIKKLVRDHGGVVIDSTHFAHIQSELGDILWYISQLCNQISKHSPYSLTMQSLFQSNMKKLNSRLTRGVVQGEGDNR